MPYNPKKMFDLYLGQNALPVRNITIFCEEKVKLNICKHIS